MTHQVAEYLAAGMDDHLAKPIEIKRLIDTLQRVSQASEISAAPAFARGAL